MNNGTINNFIDEQLRSIINDIPSLFEPDELAYISLQQKNERQIRDKVAYRLQQNLDKFGSAIVSQDIFALNQKKGNSQKKPMLYDEQNPEPFIKQLKDFWKGFTLLTFDFGDKNQIDTTKYSIQYNDPNVIRKTPEPVVKLSGESFGYHIWQTGLVWGPYKASALKVSAK